MAKTTETKPEAKPEAKARDRSPSYPSVSLQTAIDRLTAFETYFKRHPGPMNKAGLAWDMKASSSQAYSTLAAMKSYGLIDYQGAGTGRVAVLSEDGRKYLRAHQESVKREVLKRAALRPKYIAKYFAEWGADRPPDPVCLDELIQNAGFSDNGAPIFLKVYDATIAFAGLTDSDKYVPPDDSDADDEAREDKENGQDKDPRRHRQQTEKLMPGERIVFTEEGKPTQYLKLIASGEVDDGLLEALEDFVKRQRKRLQAQVAGELIGDDKKAN